MPIEPGTAIIVAQSEAAARFDDGNSNHQSEQMRLLLLSSGQTITVGNGVLGK